MRKPEFSWAAAAATEVISYSALIVLLLPPDARAAALPMAIVLTWMRRGFVHPVGRLLTALAAFLGLLAVGCFAAFEALLGRPSVYTFGILLHADAREGYAYLLASLSGRVFGLSLAAAGLLLFFFRAFKSLPVGSGRSQRLRLGLILLSIGTVLAFGVAAAKPLEGRAAFLLRAIAEFNEARKWQRELAGRLTPRGSRTALALPARREGTVVLVLSPATTRHHLSLYGYHRNTTPRLEELEARLLIHRDTVSAQARATPLLLLMLTGANARTDLRESLERNLISELRRSGYKTFWFSNHPVDGTSPVYRIGQLADVSYFPSQPGITNLLAASYDQQLIPRLRSGLVDPARKKLIVLHLLAPAGPACQAIPPENRRVLSASQGLGKPFFGSAPDRSHAVNCYDNAVRYVDSLLGEIIQMADASAAPMVVVYLSDRGADPAHGVSPERPGYARYHESVPHIWFFNGPAEMTFADPIRALGLNLARPFRTSDVFHTIIDFVGSNPQLGDGSRSLSSADYLSRPIGDPDGARDQLEALREKRPGDWPKVWAHRVNSIGKLLEAKEVFAGVELDVVFDAALNEFFVFHPPKPSHGLSLESYLEAATDSPTLRLWLDWKDAEESEFEAAFGRLLDLDGRFSMKHRTVIETGSAAVFSRLRELSRLGFRHSYYLPMGEALSCVRSPHAERCQALAAQIVRTAGQIGAGAISFGERAAPFVFAHPELQRGLRHLTWAPSVSPSDSGFADRLPEIRRYDAYLVGFRSEFSY